MRIKNNWLRFYRRKRKNGFTMIEILIVLVIVSVFSTMTVYAFQNAQRSGRDAKRKGDLEKIKVAFEDYFNDNNCYPPDSVLEQCASDEFDPYLKEIPCDPQTKDAYVYQPLENACAGYRVYAQLENEKDPAIAELNCDGPNGCGQAGYNYGISAGVPVFNGAWEADPDSPTPSPTGPIYVYACDSAGTCNQYEAGHPFLVRCPVTFPQTNCNNECGNPALRCEG